MHFGVGDCFKWPNVHFERKPFLQFRVNIRLLPGGGQSKRHQFLKTGGILLGQRFNTGYMLKRNRQPMNRPFRMQTFDNRHAGGLILVNNFGRLIALQNGAKQTFGVRHTYLL